MSLSKWKLINVATILCLAFVLNMNSTYAQLNETQLKEIHKIMSCKNYNLSSTKRLSIPILIVIINNWPNTLIVEILSDRSFQGEFKPLKKNVTVFVGDERYRYFLKFK
jgi:hypothetical protein